MNLTTIDMDTNEARRAFLAYQQEVKLRHREEDRILMKGYRELSLGRRLIHLDTVIGEGGWNERGLPCLACCRADTEHCYVSIDHAGVSFFGCPPRTRRTAHATIPTSAFPESRARRDWSARTIVPLVPPAFRPATGLHNYHILFEANWQRVPRDPALLKHVGSGIYAVVAVWDLTDLEATVLGMTRRLPR